MKRTGSRDFLSLFAVLQPILSLLPFSFSFSLHFSLYLSQLMEEGNHEDMRDHDDLSDLDQVPFMELLYGPPYVDAMEYHHNSSSSWAPPVSPLAYN
jgi:hypothetical protein